MEIEVGEYGRTNLGKIIKFAWIGYSGGKKDESKVLLINNDILSNDFYYFKIGEKIVNHSKNIIDLIEKGDYVNGYRVESVSVETNEVLLDHNGFGWRTLKDGDRIITHEQFASIEYKVGGE